MTHTHGDLNTPLHYDEWRKGHLHDQGIFYIIGLPSSYPGSNHIAIKLLLYAICSMLCSWLCCRILVMDVAVDKSQIVFSTSAYAQKHSTAITEQWGTHRRWSFFLQDVVTLSNFLSEYVDFTQNPCQELAGAHFALFFVKQTLNDASSWDDSAHVARCSRRTQEESTLNIGSVCINVKY